MDITDMTALVNETGAVDEPAATADKSKESKKILIDKMKESMKDPAFVEALNSRSGDLEVVHTLGYGDKGNLKVDAANKDARSLVATSAIVGYEVKNVSDTPIAYKTEVFTQGADGVFTGTPTDRVLQPGETAYLTRQFMTMLTAAPEFSFTLANGHITKGSGAKMSDPDKQFLSSFYFSFNKDSQKSVNDDEVKLNIAEKVDGKWVVKPEFTEVFGDLNNAKAPKAKAPKATKINRYAAYANLVYTTKVKG